MDTMLVDTILRVTILLLATSAVATGLRGQSAAVRHLAWTLSLTGCLAVPVLSAIGPDMRLPVPGLLPGVSSGNDTPLPAMPDGTGEVAALSDEVLATSSSTGSSSGPADDRIGSYASSEDQPHAWHAPAAEPLSETSSPARSEAAGLPISSILLGIWLTGVVLVGAGVLSGRARLWWLARNAVRIDAGPVWMAANRVALRLRLRKFPLILEGPAHAVPMTWGVRRPVLLLPPDAPGWPRWRLNAVLLHELGHVVRRDYAAQVIAQLACAVYWFHPLVWHAANRMRLEREHACDDLVVRSGHEPAAYAGDLVELARSFGPARLDAAALAITRRGQLECRLRAILDPARKRSGLDRRTALAAGAAVLGFSLAVSAVSPEAIEADPMGPTGYMGATAVPPLDPPTLSLHAPARPTLQDEGPVDADPVSLPQVLPAMQDARVLCDRADGQARQQLHMRNNDRRTVIRSFGDCTSSIEIDGELEFSSDFTAVTRVAPGARARIEVERDGTARRIDLHSGQGQRPEYDYRVNGDERPFDDGAREWLTLAWQDFFRSSSYMAEERAAWFLSRGGPQALLDEADQMLSDHARATYLTVLLWQPGLGSAVVTSIIDHAGATIESDHSLGELLAAAARHQDFDAASRAAFLRAARSIDSDHTQGEVFSIALSRGDLSEDDLVLLLEAAAESIDSDHTLGELLTGLADRYRVEPRLRRPFLEAAATIDSDHTAGEVYATLLRRDDLTTEDIAAVLEAARSIQSDHTLSELLIDVVGPRFADASLRSAWLGAARTIDSDHSLGETLVAFARVGDLSPDAQVDVLRAAAEIDSDHQLAEFLIEFARTYRMDGEVEGAFNQALEQVDSRHQRGRVEEVVRRG